MPEPEQRKPAFREADLGLRPGTRDASLGTASLALLAPFRDVPQAGRYPGAVILRHFRAGEIVCEQGQPGWTAFYILQLDEVAAILEAQAKAGLPIDPAEVEGARARAAAAAGKPPEPVARVSIRTPREKAKGLFDRLLSGLFLPKSRTATGKDQVVPNDGPVDLRWGKPVASMFPGEVFGEISCMHRQPRSATIQTTEDVWMVEMLRSMYDLLLTNAKFTATMDAVYRRRVLSSHLQSLPLFHGINEAAIDLVRDGATIERFKAGKVIIAQDFPGETPKTPADKMYIIRIGTVKVVQKTGAFERVLSYQERGGLIGEIGLITGVRSASCIAYDHPESGGGTVEFVGISKELIERAAEIDPRIAQRIVASKRERLGADERRGRSGDWSASALAAEAGLLPGERLLIDDLGLMQGQKLMAIDETRCTRCDACVRACADTHDDGRSRLFREGPRLGDFLIPATCRQCHDPVCMIGCPVGSIHRGDAGEITIESWCIGCGKCARQCPYGAINMYDREGVDEKVDASREMAQPVVAVVCDQCVDNGGVPSCVYACPHDAAIRKPASEILIEYTERAGRDPKAKPAAVDVRVWTNAT